MQHRNNYKAPEQVGKLCTIDMTTKRSHSTNAASASSKYAIFHTLNWYTMKYDKRKKLFRHITKEQFCEAAEKRMKRFSNQVEENKYIESCQIRRWNLEFFAAVPYVFKGDYLDDFSFYQRPSSNGIGYVAICPGERGNNIYINDPILVKYLKSKYEKHMAAHPEDRPDMQP